jgi:hypothetical protein
MGRISTFLAVYFFFMAVLPCSESFEYFTLHISSIFMGAETSHYIDDDGHENDNEDYCSPFCMCSAYKIMGDEPQLQFITLQKPIRKKSNKPRSVINLIDFSTGQSVFQPPRQGLSLLQSNCIYNPFQKI